MSDFDSILRMGADTRGLLKGVDALDEVVVAGGKAEKATDKTGDAFKRAGSAADASKARLVGLAKSLGIAAAGFVSFAAVSRLVNAGAADMDRAAKAARRLETSITGFRAMELAAGEAGVALSTLTDGVQTMDREIARGSKAATEAMTKLGLSAKDLAGTDADQKLALVADKIKTLGLSTGQASALLQDFGIRNREMILAVMGGGDAFRSARDDIADYGLAITTVETDKIEAAQDAIGRLGLIGQYAGQQLSLAFTPALGAMATAMTDSLREGGLLRGVIDGLVAVAQRLGSYFVAAAGVMTALYAPALIGAALAAGKLVAALVLTRAALIRTGIGIAVVAAGELVYQFMRLVDGAGGFGKAMALLGDVVSAVWQGMVDSAAAIPPALNGVWELMKGGFFKALSSMATKFHDFVWTIANGMRGIEGLEGAGAALMGLATTASDASGKLFTAGHEAEGAAKGSFSNAAGTIKSAFGPARAAVAAMSAAVIDNGKSSMDGAKAVDRLNNSLGNVGGGKGGGGGGKGSANDAADALERAAEEAKKLKEEMDRPLVSAIDGVANAFGDFIAGGLRDFGGFVKTVLSSFKNMISQMIATAVSNPIKLALGVGGGVGGAGAAAAAPGIAGGGAVGGLGSLGGLSGMLGGIVSQFSSGIGLAFSGLTSGGLGGMFGAIGGQLGAVASGVGSISAAVGAIALPIAGLAAAFSFFKKKTTQLDAGIKLTVNNMQTLVDTFTTTKTTRFWGLSKKIRTSFDRAEDAVADPIERIVGQIQGGVLDAANALGVSAMAFSDFSHLLMVSTKGMSDAEAQQAVENALTGLGDAFAGMIPGINAYRKAGEGAMDAVTRLAGSLGPVNLAMDTLGHRLFAVSLAGGDAASNLADLFGGLESFNSATTTYFQGFYTEQERFDTALRQITARFADLGVIMPKTREDFRAMVDAIDTSSVAGREMYASLVSMAGALSQVLPAIASFTLEIQKMVSGIATEIDAMIGDTSSAMQANQQAASLWYKTANTLRDFIADMKGTAGALVSGAQARAFNEARYQSILASAMSGDNQAATDITGAASALLKSTQSTARTALEQARAEARVLSDLSLLGGVSDVEGARHDVIAGLLGDQVGVLQEVKDYLTGGGALDPDQIDALNGKLGGLSDAIKAAEMINYAFLRERLAVTVDLLATANLPADVRKLIANAQTGIKGTIDFVVRSDLAPDQKWLALTGSSEHIKTIKYLVDNSQWSKAAQDVALGAAGTYAKTVKFISQNTMTPDLTSMALGSASTLLKSIKFTASGLSADDRAIALNQITALEKTINFMMGDNIPDNMQSLALDDASAFKRVIDFVAGKTLPAQMQTLALAQPTAFVRTLNVLAGAVPSGRMMVLALDAATAFRRVINVTAGSTVDATTARLALDSVSSLNRTINLVAKNSLSADEMRLALAGNSELSRVVNVALSSKADKSAVQLALANAGTYSVAVRASLSADKDVRKVVFGDTGSYAAMIEAAFSQSLSKDARRVLLTRQGIYAVNILGTLGTGLSPEMKVLMLNANTSAVRAVTVGMAFASTVSAAERDLLLTKGTEILRTIKAGVNAGGVDSFGVLYLDQLFHGSPSTLRGVKAGVDGKGINADGWAYMDQIYAGSGAVFRGVLAGVDGKSVAPSGWAYMRQIYAGDGSVTRAVDAGISWASMSETGWSYLKQLNLGVGQVNRGLAAGVNLGGIDALGVKYFGQLIAGKGTVDRILKGDVDLSALNASQLSLLDAVQGNSTGTLKLGGSFTFDPAASFKTWYDSATKTNMAAPMATLSNSLNDLRAAIMDQNRQRAADKVIEGGNAYASKLVDFGKGQYIATDDQVKTMASKYGINTNQSIAALKTQVAGFSTTDNIEKIASYNNASRDYMIGLTQRPGLQVDAAQYYKMRPDVLKAGHGAQEHWDKWGRAEMAKSANWFNPRMFDWSSIGVNLPNFDGGGHTGDGPRSGGMDGKGGFLSMLHPKESVIDHTKGPYRYQASSSNDNAEMVKELRALRKEVAELRKESASGDREKIKLLRRTSDTLEKFDNDGLPKERV